MNGDKSTQDYLHKEYPKQFEKDEFWNQIKRTVNGKPVSEEDIQMIVDQIERHLDLGRHNHVLDLGCGNAALASRFFEKINNYTGVDFSEYLLQIAEEFFNPHAKFTYIESDIRQIENFSTHASIASEIDKILIYGCIAYLSKTDTRELLDGLKSSFPNLKRVFIGNIPDANKAKEFFDVRGIESYELDSPQTPIGVWWTQDEFSRLGDDLGFHSNCHTMPKEFYGGTYRFDLVLESRSA